jgi:integrase
MASVFKSKGSKRYTIMFSDEHGNRRKRRGYTDKGETMKLAIKLEERARKIRDGLVDPRDEQFRDHDRRPIAEHLEAWSRAMDATGSTTKHVELFASRARRVIAIVGGAAPQQTEMPGRPNGEAVKHVVEGMAKAVAPVRLHDLTQEKVQQALSALKDHGLGLLTVNHYGTAVKAFSKWCMETHRTREYALRGLIKYNAKEDRRHDRRTISLDELRRLIEVAECGGIVRGMPGPVRALCYRLAVATGLRYSELQSIHPKAFDWRDSNVTVAAAYTKNGDPATFHLSNDLLADLAAYVATRPPDAPVFPLPKGRGAEMLRVDLRGAGIPYRDGGGLVFDFHSLRCETATLADAAGVSPRVVQRLMRHSKEEMTSRYTRPRTVDIHAAAERIPSLRPAERTAGEVIMTGTDSTPVASEIATHAIAYASNSSNSNIVAVNRQRSYDPLRQSFATARATR